MLYYYSFEIYIYFLTRFLDENSDLCCKALFKYSDLNCSICVSMFEFLLSEIDRRKIEHNFDWIRAFHNVDEDYERFCEFAKYHKSNEEIFYILWMILKKFTKKHNFKVNLDEIPTKLFKTLKDAIIRDISKNNIDWVGIIIDVCKGDSSSFEKMFTEYFNEARYRQINM